MAWKDKLTFPPLDCEKEYKWASCSIYYNNNSKLHRISSIDREFSYGFEGTAVCGTRSRYWRKTNLKHNTKERCKKCCNLLDMPQGKGHPAKFDDEWKDY